MGQHNHKEKYIKQDVARMENIIHAGAEEQQPSAGGSITSTAIMVRLTNVS
jgi:hypothetical protein